VHQNFFLRSRTTKIRPEFKSTPSKNPARRKISFLCGRARRRVMQLTLPGGVHRHYLARSLPAYEKAELPRSSDIRLPRTMASSTNNANYTRRRIRWEIDENRRRNPSYHRKSWSGMRNSQYGAAPISASDVDGELRAQRQRHPYSDSAGNRGKSPAATTNRRGIEGNGVATPGGCEMGHDTKEDEGGRIRTQGDDVSCELDRV
jgi:hypothetical protein